MLEYTTECLHKVQLFRLDAIGCINLRIYTMNVQRKPRTFRKIYELTLHRYNAIDDLKCNSHPNKHTLSLSCFLHNNFEDCD